MSSKHLLARAQRIEKILFPRAKRIHCEHAKDDLLTMLEMQMAHDEDNEMVEWTEEQISVADELDAFLDADVKRIEEECNVRLV